MPHEVLHTTAALTFGKRDLGDVDNTPRTGFVHARHGEPARVEERI